MEISIFSDIILNVILICFPILLYLVLVIYIEKFLNKYDDLLLCISLLTSLYLCLRFKTETSSNEVLLFCNIPIVIAFIKKKESFAIVLSLVSLLYFYQINKVLLIISLIKYISYFILYLVSKKRNLSKNNFILSTAVLQGFFLSFEYFFLEIKTNVNDLVILLILVFLYYFITFFIVYIYDALDKIKELNKTIKILEKEKKIKDALFKLTHEIKNPLAVCKGYLEMIDIDKKEKAEKYLKIMQEEINRSLNIMKDFIQFNKIKINKEKININYLLEDVYSSFKVVGKAKGIKIIYKKKNDELYVDCDYERIKQVLVNLLKNSIEAINHSDGIIEINRYLNKEFVEIEIKDNGSGMDKETMSKIKEMFYTTKEYGTGLGVSLSNEIIEAHGGTLNYYSNENIGTSVKISIPI